MRRKWAATDAAAVGQTKCLACGRNGPLQRAHVISRARDRGAPTQLDVVMLCPVCHLAYDAHDLDLYPLLDPPRLARAVKVAGGEGHALRRLMGAGWRTADGALLDARLAHLRALGADF